MEVLSTASIYHEITLTIKFSSVIGCEYKGTLFGRMYNNGCSNYLLQTTSINSTSGSEEIDDRGEDRSDVHNWCKCDHCTNMDKYVERVCCREVPESVRRLCEAVTQYDDINMPLDCITEHPGFQLNCLRWEVLENAWLAYKQQYGAQAYDHNHLHKRYRHVAYRQLARFLFGIVGKENRYALPSCAVNAIRLTFPSPNNQYTGYDTGY